MNTLTSEQAEEVLIALAMRAQQRGLGNYQRQFAEEIGDTLAAEFRAQHGWDTENVFRAHLAMPRSVIVKEAQHA